MEHDGCKGCKYEHCSPESKECQGCKQNSVDKYKRMTNADRIRSMSDEELAEFYEFTFNADKLIDTEEFYKILGIDIANMPDAYDIQFIKFVQARKHKKRRINKKWLKRYGYKQITVESKGWKMKTDTNGNVEFIK